MNKQEFIHQFIVENGYLPDEETVQELFHTPIGRKPSLVSSLGSRRTVDRGSDLLGELRGILGDIGTYARASARRNPLTKKSSPWSTELGFMALIFMAKTGLYFALKSTYEAGYDFTNI